MAKTIIEKISLYKGEVEIDFYPNSHAYKINGKRIVGVTTVLKIIDKPQLLQWAVNQACTYLNEKMDVVEILTPSHIEQARYEWKNTRDTAANIGHEVHAWAEAYIKGLKPATPTTPEVLNGVTAFLAWVEKHNVEFVSSERFVYSRKHNYAGQMDAEAIIDGKLCVIDFKTGSGIYPEMLMQTAAYQKAAQEEGSRYNGARRIVRFDKTTGKFEVRRFPRIQKDYAAFLAALKLRQRMNEIKKLI